MQYFIAYIAAEKHLILEIFLLASNECNCFMKPYSVIFQTIEQTFSTFFENAIHFLNSIAAGAYKFQIQKPVSNFKLYRRVENACSFLWFCTLRSTWDKDKAYRKTFLPYFWLIFKYMSLILRSDHISFLCAPQIYRIGVQNT